jgi:hypothetical protein
MFLNEKKSLIINEDENKKKLKDIYRSKLFFYLIKQ